MKRGRRGGVGKRNDAKKLQSCDSCEWPHFPGLFAGRVRMCLEPHEPGRVKIFFNLAGWVRSDQKFFESKGLHWVGSRFFQSSRVGSGRVGSRGVMISPRIGPGHNPRETGHARVGPTCPAFFFVAVPRVGPAHPARGSNTSKHPHFSQKFFLYQHFSFGIRIKH